jgi:hypothetical protein
MNDQEIKATAKRVYKMIEDMAGSDPNRPLGDLWTALREDRGYTEAITRWQIFGEE